ncbi:MAG TPA: YdcF family protein [Allosphingosinicella sp.]|nr:YdcF family protein [Allosphingosinicella sp.]
MIRWTIRLVALLLALYGIGFAVFALTLPRAAGDERTDAIVVLTGSPGRLERGFALLEQDRAQAVLISGVPTGARPQDYAARYGVDPSLFPAKIALGQDSVDTRTNAEEVARWLQRRRYRSIRLVTSDLHMHRAYYEIGRRVGGDVTILTDAVVTNPGFVQIYNEYNKYLMARAAGLVGL